MSGRKAKKEKRATERTATRAAVPPGASGGPAAGGASSGRIGVARWLHSTRVQLVLYSLLLVGTPFIMLRAYMQDAIGRFSESTFAVGELDVPWVLVIAAAAGLVAFGLLRPRVTRRRVAAAVVGLGMVALAQQVTDYYFGHRFYELQFNWHYIAYTLFALLVYRDLRPRGVPLARLVLVTAALAALFSAFDEGFQLVVNTRVFDMGDIAKDLWGAITGLTMLLVGTEHPEVASGGGWRRVRHARLRDYLFHAPSVWVLLVVCAWSFLSFASLLTEPEHITIIIGLTVTTTAAAWAVLHLSQRRWPGRILLAGAVAGALALATSFVMHRHEHVHVYRPGWTVYKGIPIPYFDVLFYPGGGFRLVDKKRYFNERDQAFFLRTFEPDVIIIGAGYEGQGGAGYPHRRGSGFVFNRYTGRGTQVIILDSAAACAHYNEQKAGGKDVLFILHTGA